MLVVVVVGVLAGGALAAPSTAEPLARAAASPTVAPVPGCDDPDTPIGDLDADGVPEVVVGMPTYPGGGAVDVRYTGGGGTVVTAATLGVWTRSTADRFGTAVVVTELNGDRCADLVIGSPGHAGTGAVVIAHGNPQGWGPAEAFLVPTATRKAGAEFGAALTVFQSYKIEGSFSVLAVGMPGYRVNGHANAGAVVGYPMPAGVVGAPVAVTQDTPGVPGSAETGDRLGAVLATGSDEGLLAGMPLEDVGDRVDAGIVLSLGLRDGRWSGRTWSEDTPGVPGVAEAGDHFGAAVVAAAAPFDINYLQLSFGVPGEDVGSARDVGTVVSVLATGEDLSVIVLHQDGLWQGQEVPGTAAPGDLFGSSLGFSSALRRYALVVGIPGKDVGSASDAGALVTFASSGTTLSTSALTEADVTGGHAEAGDRFAATMAAGMTQESSDPPGASGGRLLLGIPGEDVRGARDAGALAFGESEWTLRAVTLSSGPRARLAYGSVLGAPTWSL